MKKYLIAIDAGGTFMKSAIVSNNAEIVDGSIYSTEANSDLDAEAVRQGYIRTLEAQLKNAARQNIELSAVAIDTPGPFDYENGYSLMQHKYKAIYKLPLRPWIQEIVDLPVTFIHDSAAYLTGELWHSPYGDYKNAAGVMIGTGTRLRDNERQRRIAQAGRISALQYMAAALPRSNCGGLHLGARHIRALHKGKSQCKGDRTPRVCG